jgi:TfoX/Sxy family transcriptional regulator of competence genes
MAANEALLQRVRTALADVPKVREKKMFRGVTFMVDGKMCVSVSGDELMCRIDPEIHGVAIQRKGVRPMVMKGREYRGYIYVNEEGLKSDQDFEYWVKLCQDFNPRAKAAKGKSTGQRKRK